MQGLHEIILSVLGDVLSVPQIHIGYSGGMDSHVLLHALSQVRHALPPISAIYIDHQIQAESAAWGQHCEHVCAQLNVPFQIIAVDGNPQKRESPEEAARIRRYAAWEALLHAREQLLLAQHQQDQAETVLLQLMRGAGPAGLAAMPERRPLGKGQLVRPLLKVDQALIRAYALKHQLQWIEDPSNQSLQYDRNFLRHQVMPLLLARWPHMNRRVQQTTEICASYHHWVNDRFNDLLVPVMVTPERLSLNRLQAHSDLAVQTQIVRCWLLHRLGKPPSQKQLTHIVQDLIQAPPDRKGKVCFGQACVCRYADDLYWVPYRFAHANPARKQCWSWDLTHPLRLPKGQLVAATPLEGLSVEVGFRLGGERCCLLGHNQRKSLKQLFQENRIPPWERDWIPIIRIAGEIAQIGSLYHTQEIDKWLKNGLNIRWETSCGASSSP